MHIYKGFYKLQKTMRSVKTITVGGISGFKYFVNLKDLLFSRKVYEIRDKQKGIFFQNLMNEDKTSIE